MWRAMDFFRGLVAHHGGAEEAFAAMAGAGFSFRDKEGTVRTEIRRRWYLPPDGHTYGTYALQTDEIVCPVPLEESVIDAAAHYPADAKPVFIGHYWLSAPRPKLLAENVACLDYSVAKGWFLCAYQWDGERRLTDERFVWGLGTLPPLCAPAPARRRPSRRPTLGSRSPPRPGTSSAPH
jgi:hypothetical protein